MEIKGDTSIRNIKLLITKAFLENFFEYIYYSTLPDYILWNKKTSIIIEPISILQVKDFKIIDWKLVDEWLDHSFIKSKIRNVVENDMNYVDGSDLEQILYPISENVYELGDNPILYPKERLAKLVRDILPKNPDIIELIDGICHFHPSGDAYFSEIDCITLKKFANLMGKYGKEYIIGLVIAKNDSYKFIKEAKTTKNQFVDFMMNDLLNTSFKARIFFPNGLEKNLDIYLE